MSDLRLAWGIDSADLNIVGNDIDQDGGLETAVILSLFTDKRAQATDTLPDGQDDRRGWWGDVLPPVASDQIGSRLWLLAREKQLQIVVDRAREYASDALKWLLDDKVAERIDITAEITQPGILGLQIVIVRPMAANAEFKFDYVWTAQAALG